MNLDFSENIVLENDRCRLEPLSYDDHFDALNPISDAYPDLLQYSPSHFGSKENLTKYIAHAAQRRQDNNWYSFAVFDKLNKKYAGSSSYLCVSNYDKRLEIGATWIDRSLQGTQLNSNMKFLMLSYAFEELGAERVEFRIDARNIRSQKAVLKLGASFEGMLRSHTLMLDGHRRDTHYYSLLKSEWPSNKTVLKSALSVS